MIGKASRSALLAATGAIAISASMSGAEAQVPYSIQSVRDYAIVEPASVVSGAFTALEEQGHALTDDQAKTRAQIDNRLEGMEHRGTKGLDEIITDAKVMGYRDAQEGLWSAASLHEAGSRVLQIDESLKDLSEKAAVRMMADGASKSEALRVSSGLMGAEFLSERLSITPEDVIASAPVSFGIKETLAQDVSSIRGYLGDLDGIRAPATRSEMAFASVADQSISVEPTDRQTTSEPVDYGYVEEFPGFSVGTRPFEPVEQALNIGTTDTKADLGANSGAADVSVDRQVDPKPLDYGYVEEFPGLSIGTRPFEPIKMDPVTDDVDAKRNTLDAPANAPEASIGDSRPSIKADLGAEQDLGDFFSNDVGSSIYSNFPKSLSEAARSVNAKANSEAFADIAQMPDRIAVMLNRDQVAVDMDREHVAVDLGRQRTPVELDRQQVAIEIDRQKMPVELDRTLIPVELDRKRIPIALDREGTATPAASDVSRKADLAAAVRQKAEAMAAKKSVAEPLWIDPKADER